MSERTEEELFADVESRDPSRKDSGAVIRRPRVEAIDRDQMVLRPVNVEELVAPDDEVRAIWEVVGRFDLSGFYEPIKAVEGVAGREAKDPRMLISLWIYGYKQGVSSGREIGRLCEYHPGFQWLTGLEPVNYHTLTDFRVKHKEALDQLFKEILALLSMEGIITLERVMHDGTKIKACAGGDTFRTGERLREHLKQAQEQVAAMGDPRSAPEVGPRVKAAQERAARERQARLELALVELEKIRAGKETKDQAAAARASETDPESRIMKQGNDGGYAPSYNVQISTDAKEKAIVGVGLSQAPADAGELPAAMDRVEENVGEPVNQAVADGGYTNRETILKMEKRGIDMIGSIQDPEQTLANSLKARGIDPAFGPQAFVYEAATDRYRCPEGKILLFENKTHTIGRIEYHYRANAMDCQGCSLKEKCCPKGFTAGRTVVRGIEDPTVVAFRAKMQTEHARAIYKQRGPVAEFPNAWIKEKLKLRQFRVRGIVKAALEMMWAAVTYNLQLWIRLKWRPQFAGA